MAKIKGSIPCRYGNHCVNEDCSFNHSEQQKQNSIYTLKRQLKLLSLPTILHLLEILYPLDSEVFDDYSYTELLRTILTREDILNDLCLYPEDVRAGIYFFERCHTKEASERVFNKFIRFLTGIAFPDRQNLEFSDEDLIREHFQMIGL
jgi:hypothetical protein